MCPTAVTSPGALSARGALRESSLYLLLLWGAVCVQNSSRPLTAGRQARDKHCRQSAARAGLSDPKTSPVWPLALTFLFVSVVALECISWQWLLEYRIPSKVVSVWTSLETECGASWSPGLCVEGSVPLPGTRGWAPAYTPCHRSNSVSRPGFPLSCTRTGSVSG